MSNFPSNASYGHASAEAQPGNPPAHTVIDLSYILTPVHRLDIAVTNADALRFSHVENFCMRRLALSSLVSSTLF